MGSALGHVWKTVNNGTTFSPIFANYGAYAIGSIMIDPRNPHVVWLGTGENAHQRALGYGNGVYKSEDGGKTWRKLTNGLPSGHVGGGCIEVYPVNPDYVYLIKEAAKGKGGFFRSSDRGASRSKMNDYRSSGQYFNMIVCDPIDVNKVYSLEVVLKVTIDGGKTWNNIGLNKRHIYDHCMWINPKNTNHWLIGGDGGLYETYDAGDHYIQITH